MLRDLLLLCAIVMVPATAVVASSHAVGHEVRRTVTAANLTPRPLDQRCR